MSSNKSFGVVFFLVLGLFGIWPYLNGGDPIYWLILLSFVFLFLGLINSKVLTPLNKIWIKFGEILGRIIAPLVMGMIYFVILTPIGILMKLFGKDLLNIKFSKIQKSYWLKRKKNIGSMRKQF
tara:strand:+ start:254 stop:625 length:372 start_codon:yes stop_codon:yes gene_type:complete